MKLLFDLHTHTLMSGHAYSTLAENMACARANGLLAYGFSEHAPKMPGSVTEIYFMNFKAVPPEVDGLQVFGGVEANIMDYEGNIDCSPNMLRSVRYIIASLHSLLLEPGTMEENTQAIIGAMENPKVKIIGHPDDGHYPIDLDAVVQAAVRTETALELNTSSLSPLCHRLNGPQNIRDIILKCMEYGAKMIVGSDAHFCTEVGYFDPMLEVLEELEVPEELILNTDLAGLDYVLNTRD